jgi:hypothetical protein
VIELLKVIGPLTDPTAHGGSTEDAFDLVLPSLPGYGFSDAPRSVGCDPGRTARAWAAALPGNRGVIFRRVFPSLNRTPISRA